MPPPGEVEHRADHCLAAQPGAAPVAGDHRQDDGHVGAGALSAEHRALGVDAVEPEGGQVGQRAAQSGVTVLQRAGVRVLRGHAEVEGDRHQAGAVGEFGDQAVVAVEGADDEAAAAYVEQHGVARAPGRLVDADAGGPPAVGDARVPVADALGHGDREDLGQPVVQGALSFDGVGVEVRRQGAVDRLDEILDAVCVGHGQLRSLPDHCVPGDRGTGRGLRVFRRASGRPRARRPRSAAARRLRVRPCRSG